MKHFALPTLVSFVVTLGCGKRYESHNVAASPTPAAVAERAAPHNTERYDHIRDNAFEPTSSKPLSTFAIDVDTASYANVRRMLDEGRLPPADAVRIEELVNYFPYAEVRPADGHTLGVVADIAPCPWQPGNLLARVQVGSKSADRRDVVRRNLVFLIDVSGSMNDANKLPLLKRALGELVSDLGRDDRVAIVVYAGAAGVVLDSTPGDDREAIEDALDDLEAGGSTNGAGGIIAAYELAAKGFIAGGDNRVLLATDGDFNVGQTSDGELVRLIEDKKKTGVYLTVLGFGGGNYNDAGLEGLADRGNGNYFYIDSLDEARKVLVDDGGANLVTVARDVKIQVEMNPAAVARYRLIGYENRALRDEDFANDRVDGGEIGPGHTVTALYELVPAGHGGGADVALRYQGERDLTAAAQGDELFTVKVRYQSPDITKTESRLVERAVSNVTERFERMPDDFRFAAAVAAFGMLLRGSEHKGNATVADVLAWADGANPEDDALRAEFVQLVRAAAKLAARDGDGSSRP